ncbi:MAG TPA: GNAT family N-acetyltransferase [Rhodanobacter sp.]|nr:GNAT family N-acetyltransferase [Rhodanobacter sp.]
MMNVDVRDSLSVGSTRPELLTVRVIEDAAAWDAIRCDWDALHAVSPTASTTLEFTWLRQWWRIYGPVYGAGGLCVITLWRGADLAGALPLYRSRTPGSVAAARCLRFISTGEAEFEETCADYLDLLHLPGDEEVCARAAWDAIDAMDWDTLILLDMPERASLLRWRDARSARRRSALVSRGSCPIARIGSGFEAYLEQLSSKTRMRARQELRKVERAGAVFELATEADLDTYFDDLIRIHQERWTADGQPGCFAAPRFTAFHRSLVREWVGSGRAILGRLSYRGQACVLLYGFVTGDKFDLYQLGTKSVEGGVIHSPGMVANLLLMARLSTMGVARYDFLRGVTTFKRSLTNEQCNLVSLECRRRTPRAQLELIEFQLRRFARKILKLLFRR